MRYHRFQNRLAFSALGLAFILGCEQKPPKVQPGSKSAVPSEVTMDDVKRDASTSLNTTVAYSQQEKDKIVAEMKAKMADMDAKIEKLRLKGKDLSSEAKVNWDLKMTALEEKRKLANDRLAEIGESTSKAWSDVATGAKSAWDELSKAFQEASKEF